MRNEERFTFTNKLSLVDVPISENVFLFHFVTHEIAVSGTRLTIIQCSRDVVSTILGVEIQGQKVPTKLGGSGNNKNENKIRTHPHQALCMCQA